MGTGSIVECCISRQVASGIFNSGVCKSAVAVIGINGCQLSDSVCISDSDIGASRNVRASVGSEVAGGVGNRGVRNSTVAVISINGCQLSDGGRIRDNDIFTSSNVGTGVGYEVADVVLNCIAQCSISILGINDAS